MTKVLEGALLWSNMVIGMVPNKCFGNFTVE